MLYCPAREITTIQWNYKWLHIFQQGCDLTFGGPAVVAAGETVLFELFATVFSRAEFLSSAKAPFHLPAETRTLS